MQLHTSKLDELCHDIADCHANVQAPAVLEKYGNLQLVFDANVDQELSPYSQEYFDQQLNLYREIAGRDLNQESGELHPFEGHRLLDAPNPIGILDAAQMGAHVRALTTMLGLSCVSGRARILDMGAGHGLSSEVFAFTGCHVHAVDIDPGLAALSRERARRRNLDILRSDMNFDDISAIEDGAYDAAFFFQSLHHCLKPWRLIEQLKNKLKPEGVIGFVGEPLQTFWWKHWGLRLDLESLFVARSQGWFESGFSHSFIADCFKRNGMELLFFNGGHTGGEIGIASPSTDKLRAIREAAVVLGLRELDPSRAGWAQETRYVSQCGDRAEVFGRPGFRQHGDERGALLYGPYINLDRGKYELSMTIGTSGDGGRVAIEVVSDLGQNIIFTESVQATDGKAMLIVREFTAPTDSKNVEVRAVIDRGNGWSVSLPVIRALS